MSVYRAMLCNLLIVGVVNIIFSQMFFKSIMFLNMRIFSKQANLRDQFTEMNLFVKTVIFVLLHNVMDVQSK